MKTPVALASVSSLLVSMATLAAKYPAIIELIERIVGIAMNAKSEKEAWRKIVRAVLTKAGPEIAMAVANQILKTTTAVRGIPSRK